MGLSRCTSAPTHTRVTARMPRIRVSKPAYLLLPSSTSVEGNGDDRPGRNPHKRAFSHAWRFRGECMRPNGGCQRLGLTQGLYRPARDSNRCGRLGGLAKSTSTIETTETPENPINAAVKALNGSVGPPAEVLGDWRLWNHGDSTLSCGEDDEHWNETRKAASAPVFGWRRRLRTF